MIDDCRLMIDWAIGGHQSIPINPNHQSIINHQSANR
jgi:hypothetical protein